MIDGEDKFPCLIQYLKSPLSSLESPALDRHWSDLTRPEYERVTLSMAPKEARDLIGPLAYFLSS